MMTNQILTTDIGTLTPYLHMLVIHSQALFCVVNDFKALHYLFNHLLPRVFSHWTFRHSLKMIPNHIFGSSYQNSLAY